MVYRMNSEIPPVALLKLKLEINTREHFSALPLKQHPFAVESGWFTGQCHIPTYHLNELLGTKLRALFQRKKGRDLFDLWHGLTTGGAVPAVIVATFKKYMKEEGHSVSQKEFRENLANKIKDPIFLGDTKDLLRPGIEYDHRAAHQLIDQRLLSLL